MPFKVYTYADPYKLDQCHFWPEIISVPHLCVAQTLANAIRDMYGKNLRALVCPINNLLKHAYGDWFGNVHRQLRQHGALTEMLSAALRKGNIKNALHKSFRHNKRDVLEAIRLFVELGIDPLKLTKGNFSPEQSYFIDLLQQLGVDPMEDAFALSDIQDTESLRQSFVTTAEYERNARLVRLEEWVQQAHSRRDQEALHAAERVIADTNTHYDQLGERFQSCPIKVVIHGIHQFTPLQLRLVQRMDELGIEIIFMFNYQEQHAATYSTWQRVYRPFGVEPHADLNLTHFTPSVNCRGHDLAVAMSSLLEGTYSPQARSALQQLIQDNADPLFIEYANTMEFSNSVSELFRQAQAIDAHNPLFAMREQVYSASRSIHEILRVSNPEYTGERHLLAYPVGQFFVSLYRMWNHESQQLTLDKSRLLECLGSGLLQSGSSERLLRIHNTACLCYEDVKSFSDFVARMELYRTSFSKVNGEKPFPNQMDLRRLSIYDEELLSLDDLLLLSSAVTELNSLAVSLFEPAGESGEYILLKQHFDRLEEFLQQGLTSLVQKEEAQLIKELLDRLNSNQHDDTMRSTMNDLRDGLYFYLRQQAREQDRWIVRNFEQIDGDILRSRAQHREAIAKNQPSILYHFAYLSDKNMNKAPDDLLPWPLTDKFIREAYFPSDIAFQVYHTALSEYSHFLRYALFYGLFYNDCDVRLSYVKKEGRDLTQPYFILQCMGIDPTPKSFKISTGDIIRLEAPSSPLPSTAMRTVWPQAMTFYLCPYRYFLDYVLERHPALNDKFSITAFYVNILIRAGWERVAKQPYSAGCRVVRAELERVNATMIRFFPYMRNVNDNYDLISQAENYVIHRLREGAVFSPYDAVHMDVRLQFKKAVYTLEIDEWNHPDKYCHSLVDIENGKTKVSVYKVQRSVQAPLCQAISDYLEHDRRCINPAEWCHYCPHKAICFTLYCAQGSE